LIPLRLYSLWDRVEITSLSLQHATSNSLRSYFDFSLIAFRFHFDLTSISHGKRKTPCHKREKVKLCETKGKRDPPQRFEIKFHLGTRPHARTSEQTISQLDSAPNRRCIHILIYSRNRGCSRNRSDNSTNRWRHRTRLRRPLEVRERPTRFKSRLENNLGHSDAVRNIRHTGAARNTSLRRKH
jgi:hypothetical protein